MNSTGSTEEATSLSRSEQWHAVTASFLGWTLDAFDFFLVIFLVDTLAVHFQVTKSAIIWTLTATLALRRPWRRWDQRRKAKALCESAVHFPFGSRTPA